jgi:hypothetical protein
MLKKALLSAVCVTSFCFADNFLIDQQSVKEKESKTEHAEEQNKLPQRVVIEDINPSSELGQLVGVMLKNEQKRASVAAVAASKPKPVVKKKVAKKKKPKKKVAAKKAEAMNKDVHMEIKSEEAVKVSEPEKKEAEHNENNSSLKKVSSSNVCN